MHVVEFSSEDTWPPALLCSNGVHSGIHIAAAILALIGLVRPFECFGAAFTRKAAVCCTKGKCLPSKDADECCKGAVPSAVQLTTAKAPEQSIPLPALMVIDIALVIPAPSFEFRADEVHRPPGSPPGSRLNLPLLI